MQKLKVTEPRVQLLPMGGDEHGEGAQEGQQERHVRINLVQSKQPQGASRGTAAQPHGVLMGRTSTELAGERILHGTILQSALPHHGQEPSSASLVWS